MRILLVNYEYPPLGGGGGVLTRTLAHELAKRHDVIVLTSRGPGTPADAYDRHLRVVRVPVVGRRDPSKASFSSLLSFVPAARRAGRRLVHRRQFDVVHTFFAVPSGPAGSAIAARAGAPHVLTVIGADIHDPSRIGPARIPPLRAVVGRMVRGASAVTAISTDIAERATALTGRTDIVVVPCGVEHPPLPPRDRAGLGWRDETTIVVTVARLVKRKALDTLIEAIARTPGTVLEVIGDGPERSALERGAPAGRVRFTGLLERDEVMRRLVSADVFALASLHEGFGLVYLEAMHAGLPVVAGTVGGQTDFLTDGLNALLVPPGEVTALAFALHRLESDANLRHRLVESGRETVKRFSAEAMAAAYEDVYRGAVAHRARVTYPPDTS